MRTLGRLGILGLLLSTTTARALAEPYLALRTGLKCSSCHMNRTGGGGRTTYGAGYGRQTLPWPRTATWPNQFEGAVTDHIRLGADLRGAYQVTFPENAKNLEEFVLSAAQLYAGVDLVPEHVSIYVDESVAPGGALNREAFLLLRPGKAGVFFKGGRFFPPYGWRLLDDGAAIRRYTGFSFASPDTGFEVGAEPGPWSLALAVTNGAAGASETNNGKQVTFSGWLVRKVGRVGISGTDNDLPGDARHQSAALSGGIHAGPVVALAEWDLLRDHTGGGAPVVEGAVSHLELDWLVVPGLTLRAWAGRYDPDRDTGGDSLDQAGLGADWTVFPGVQIRAFHRHRDGPASVAGSRDGQAVLELHAYF